MITRGDIATKALEMAGIIDSLTAVDPRELQSTLFHLQAMALGWESKGLQTGFKLAEDIMNIDPNEDSGVSDVDILAFVSNLSFNICSIMGRMASPVVASMAKESYANLFDTVPPTYNQNPMQPTGAGDRGCCYGWHNSFMNPEPDKIDVEDSTPIDEITI